MSRTFFPAIRSPEQEVVLQPRRRLRNLVIGLVVAAILWEAIVLSFFFLAQPSFVKDLMNEGVFGYLFLGGLAFGLIVGPLVFVVLLIRIGLLARVFGPARVVVSAHPLRLGDTFRVVAGQALKRDMPVGPATLKLVAQEVAVWRRGTRSKVETHTVFEQQHTDPNPVVDGQVVRAVGEFQIPADAMHSLTGDNNRIEWLLSYSVEVPAYPDVSEEFLLEVLPVRTSKVPLPVNQPLTPRVLREFGQGTLAINLREGKLGQAQCYELGETITGEVELTAVEAVPCRGVRLELVWQTRGKGTAEAHTVWQDQVHQGPLEPGTHRFRFSISLPEGPASYDGELIHLGWELRAWVDLSLRRDPGSALPIWVVPPTVATTADQTS